MRNKKTSLIILCLALSLSACQNNDKSNTATSSATTSTTSSKILEPENLITKIEAAELLGAPVAEGEKRETKEIGQKICFYKPANDSSNHFLQIALTQDAFMPPGGVGSETIYRETKKMTGDSKTDVKELGNEAFIAANGLNIYKNGYYIVISTSLVHKDTQDPMLISAGKKALENLEKAK
jgi:hypothetical protein